MSVSQKAALAMDFCGNTQIPKIGAAPQRERSSEEKSVSCEALALKTSFATTAMVLELRLSQRRSLTRQEDITAWRPCHQKTHAAVSSKVHRANLPTVAPESKNVNGTTARRTCQREPPFCELRGRRSVSVICKRCETKVNPLRRSCVSKRSRCGAERMCLALGEPSAEILRVEAPRCGPIRFSVLFACESVFGSCLMVRVSALRIARYCAQCASAAPARHWQMEVQEVV